MNGVAEPMPRVFSSTPSMSTEQLDSVEDAIQAIAAGELIVVIDDADRENEGDLIMAASKASPDKVAFMIRHTSGILCAPLEKQRARELRLDPMVHDNDAPHSTAFTISVDYKEGLTTGISAGERSSTVQALANNNVIVTDFVRPGHIFPLISRTGGVLVRSGHTEAAVDLTRLGGCPPVGLLAEMVNDDGTVKKFQQLIAFAKEHSLKIISIADLIAYRQVREKLVDLVRKTTVQTSIGEARAYIYKTHLGTAQHLALVFGDISADTAVLTRIHRERILDDVFGSQMSHAKNLINTALDAIGREGQGVLLYLRQEDDSIASEQSGNEELRQAHWKEIGIGAQILLDLGVSSIRLLSGRQHQYIGLRGFGIQLIQTDRL